MKLQTLIDGMTDTNARETNFLYLERYVNDAKGNFSDHSQVDPMFSPQQGMTDFRAEYSLVSLDTLKIYEDEPDEKLIREIINAGSAKFVYHPTTLSPFLASDGNYVVSPTASTRSLMTRGLPYNFVAKTHLNKRHFRFIRRLRGGSVEHSIAVNREIRLATETGEIPSYAYLPESIGLVYGDLETGMGVIYREMTPRPVVRDETRTIIPYFSIYSKDSFIPQDKPLLFDLVERNTATDPASFFVNVILGRIQDAWAYFVRERGILPELHGQNTLLEIDREGRPTRIVHRDFQSIYSDREIRERKGLPQFKKHIAGEELEKKQQYSVVFDRFISTYLFERIVGVFVSLYPQYAFQEIAERIQDRFWGISGNPLGVFPETTYKFAYKKMIGNEVTIEDTRKPAIFR